MRVQLGDLVIINESGTIGFVTDSDDNFAIEILKRGKNTKTAWYDHEEATVLVPMSQSLEQAEKILASPLYQALK